MRRLIPCRDAVVNVGAARLLGGNVGDAPTLRVEDAEPRCHVRHPGALHGRAMAATAGRLGEPRADLWPMLRADLVAHERPAREVLINLPVHVFQTGHALLLTCALSTRPIELTRTGLTGGTAVEGPSALVRMLAPVGQVLGLGRLGLVPTGPRLSGGLLLPRADSRIRTERAGGEVAELRDRGRERGITWLRGVEPAMMTPRRELVRGQNPSHRRRRDVRDDPLGQQNIRFAAERRAFWAMHAELLKAYEGKYGAILDGKVVDYDENKCALAKRLYGRFGYQSVYVQLVRTASLPVYRLSSPRRTLQP
jgi:hypothetical protein